MEGNLKSSVKWADNAISIRK